MRKLEQKQHYLSLWEHVSTLKGLSKRQLDQGLSLLDHWVHDALPAPFWSLWMHTLIEPFEGAQGLIQNAKGMQALCLWNALAIGQGEQNHKELMLAQQALAIVMRFLVPEKLLVGVHCDVEDADTPAVQRLVQTQMQSIGARSMGWVHVDALWQLNWQQWFSVLAGYSNAQLDKGQKSGQLVGLFAFSPPSSGVAGAQHGFAKSVFEQMQKRVQNHVGKRATIGTVECLDALMRQCHEQSLLEQLRHAYVHMQTQGAYRDARWCLSTQIVGDERYMQHRWQEHSAWGQLFAVRQMMALRGQANGFMIRALEYTAPSWQTYWGLRTLHQKAQQCPDVQDEKKSLSAQSLMCISEGELGTPLCRWGSGHIQILMPNEGSWIDKHQEHGCVSAWHAKNLKLI